MTARRPAIYGAARCSMISRSVDVMQEAWELRHLIDPAHHRRNVDTPVGAVRAAGFQRCRHSDHIIYGRWKWPTRLRSGQSPPIICLRLTSNACADSGMASQKSSVVTPPFAHAANALSVIGSAFLKSLASATMKNLSHLLVLLFVFTLTGCAASGSRLAPVINPGAQAVNSYHIGVDDQLSISVWHNPDLSVSVPVRPDGRITVPLIGDVEAGGHTPEEVATEIKGKLGTYIRDPQVTVILTELRSHEYLSRVRVTGAVRTPVSIPFRQGMTVLDAVLAAGGITEFAAPNRTALYRDTEDASTKTYAIHLGRILKDGDLSSNYPVQPGDVITVPQRSF